MHSLCRDFGIIHQTSCPYSPLQNGIVERKHRTLLNAARALRIQENLPIHFWGDCVLTAVYLVNRTPTQLLKGLSPYEVLYKEPPAYDHLRVFGSLCYAAVATPHKDKFASRSIKCVFLSYPLATKGYQVLDLQVCVILACFLNS